MQRGGEGDTQEAGAESRPAHTAPRNSRLSRSLFDQPWCSPHCPMAVRTGRWLGVPINRVARSTLFSLNNQQLNSAPKPPRGLRKVWRVLYGAAIRPVRTRGLSSSHQGLSLALQPPLPYPGGLGLRVW